MKVLLSSYQCLPNEGSELGNGWHWARALTDVGHHVTVLTQPSHIIRAAAPPDIEFLHVPTGESRVQKVVAPLGALGQRTYWLDHYLRWQDAALEYMQGRSQPGFDVVHHVSWGSLHLGSRLWRLGVPLVYGPIGGGQVAPHHYRRYFGHEWPIEVMRTVSTGSLLRVNPRSRETIRNAAVTLTTNSATASACRGLGGRDVRYMLAEGLPAEWLIETRTRRPTGTPIVLWVGRFLARKAPALAVEAYAELRRRTPARLVMAGDGPLLEQTRSLVRRLGLEDDVEFLGRVPWTDINSLYGCATAFLFTSLRDSSGSQFLEALGKGVPAVALNHHGIGDADVGAAAVKVDLPTDPRVLPVLLGNALYDVVTGDAWAERSAAGVAWAAQHTWPAKAAQATTIYSDLLGTAGSAGYGR